VWHQTLRRIFSPYKYRYTAATCVPELPGCITHGDTPEHALEMAHEVIEGYTESLRRRGLAVPQPFAERKFSGKIPLRVDPTLHRDLASKADIEGVSLNKLIEAKLKKAV